MNDEFGPNFVTLTDDEGNDIELEYVDALEHNGTTYMAFFPVVEEDSEDEEKRRGIRSRDPQKPDGKRRGVPCHH